MSLFGFLKPTPQDGILVVYGDRDGVPISVYALDEQGVSRIQTYVAETENWKSLHVAVFRNMKSGYYEVIEPKYPSMEGTKVFISSGKIIETRLVFGCGTDQAVSQKEGSKMYCSYCGKPNSSDFRFCSHCGKPRA